jgi:hypothetical protein
MGLPAQRAAVDRRILEAAQGRTLFLIYPKCGSLVGVGRTARELFDANARLGASRLQSWGLTRLLPFAVLRLSLASSNDKWKRNLVQNFYLMLTWNNEASPAANCAPDELKAESR